MKNRIADILRLVVLVMFLALHVGVTAQGHRKSIVMGRPSSGKARLQSEEPHMELESLGLDGRSCRQSIEDKYGFIWVTTSNGIARFDGLRFQTFFATDSRELYVNDVSTICEDSVNNCIYATFSRRNELLCLNYNTFEQKIIPFDFNVEGMTVTDNLFVAMYNYNDSLLMMTSRFGHCFANKRTGEFMKPFDNDKSSFSRMLTVGGDVYYVSMNKLWRIVEKSVPYPALEHIEVSCLGYEKLRHIDKSSDSTIICELSSITKNGKNNGFVLCEYNINTESTRLLGEGSGIIKDMGCMDDGVWFSTNGKDMQFFDYSKNAFRNISTRSNLVNFSSISGFMKLRNQPIMCVCSHDGLIKNDYYKSKFTVTDIRRVSEAHTCNVFSVHQDCMGGYWFWAIQDGLFYRKPGENLFNKYQFSPGINEGQWGVFGCVEDTVRKLTYFQNVRRILCYDHKKEKMSVVYERQTKTNILATLAITQKGELFFVMGSVIYRYDPASGKTTEAFTDEDIPAYSCICNDGDSVLWIGDRRSRLFSYNLNTRKLVNHATLGDKPVTVLGIYAQSRNGLHEVWVATRLGLYYYLPTKRHLSKLEYGSVLNDEINCINVDNHKNVWVGGHAGVMCINNTNGSIYEYGREDMGLNIDFNNNATSLTPRGNVIMAGLNGFIEFNGDSFLTNEYFPAPVISSYRYMNSVSSAYDFYTTDEHFGPTDTITIPKGIRAMELSVRVLNYNDSHKNVYQWRAPGWQGNSDWKNVAATGSMLISNMPRGMSYIELRSCDVDGYPTSNVRRVYVNNLVFIYEYPEFWIAIGVVIMFLIVLYAVYRNGETIRRRKELEAEVTRQAGALKLANDELVRNQTIIELQNEELLQHKEDLEREVAERTADLEVARQKAEDSSKLKSAFLANLSHEVRTPMNCIVGFSKLLEDPTTSPQEQREFAHLIQESSQGMLVLIGDLLDVSRIESGHMRVNMKYFNVDREIHDVYSMLFVERKFQNVEFRLEADSDKLDRELFSDKDRFRQIIINLCYNAFKFTESGHVSIIADVIRPSQLFEHSFRGTLPKSLDCDLLLVRVEDTGIGIPQDKMDVIFEPFRKLNNNRTLYPGLGLGLNIVKNLIYLLKGQIWLTSSDHIAYHGTTFYFYLPFNEEPALEQKKE